MRQTGNESRRNLAAVLAAGLIPLLSYWFVIDLAPMCDDFFGLAAISGNLYRTEDNHKVDHVIDPEVVREFPQTAPWWTSPDAKLMFMRPLTSLLGRLEYRVWGNDTRGYLFVNVLVHSLSCMFLFLIGRRLFRRNDAALAGSLIFSSHVFNVLVISWIAEAASILSLLWIHAGIYFHVRFRQEGSRTWEALAWGLFVMAFLTRESGALCLGVYFLYDVFVWRNEAPSSWPGIVRTIRRYALAAIPFYLFVACYVLSGRGVTGHYTILDEGMSLSGEIAYVVKNLMLYLAGLLFFVPSFHDMNLDLFRRAIYLIPLLGLVSLATVFLLPGIRRRMFTRPAYPFLASWLFLSMLPTITLLTQSRYLYGAAAPFGLFMGSYLFETRQGRAFGRASGVVFYLLLCFFIAFPVAGFWAKRSTIEKLHAVQGELVRETLESLQGFRPPVQVFFVNLPNPILTFAMQYSFDYYSGKGMVRAFPLTVSKELPELTVLGERSLLITSLGKPFLESEVERLFMTELPDREGFARANAFFKATVEDVRDGHIHAIRFDFASSLSDPDMRFFFVEDNHAVPLEIPPGTRGVLPYGGERGTDFRLMSPANPADVMTNVPSSTTIQ